MEAFTFGSFFFYLNNEYFTTDYRAPQREGLQERNMPPPGNLLLQKKGTTAEQHPVQFILKVHTVIMRR